MVYTFQNKEELLIYLENELDEFMKNIIFKTYKQKKENIDIGLIDENVIFTINNRSKSIQYLLDHFIKTEMYEEASEVKKLLNQ